MLAVMDLSGVIARMNAFFRGRSQLGTHVGDRKPSVQRSPLRMRMSDMADVTDRVSCCAPLALFRDAGKGRTEMRDTSLWIILTYAWRTEATRYSSAAASAVAIAEERGLNRKTQV